MNEQAFEIRLMKQHRGNKWEARSFSISPLKGISWDGEKKRKIILASEIVRIRDTSDAPNSLLKNCGFVIELSSGKKYTLCAASQRQKLDVAGKIQDAIDLLTMQQSAEKEKEKEREAQRVLAHVLHEKERMLKLKMQAEHEREAQEAVLAKQAEKERAEAQKRSEEERHKAAERQKIIEEENSRQRRAEEERTRLMVEEERRKMASSRGTGGGGGGGGGDAHGHPVAPPRTSGAVKSSGASLVRTSGAPTVLLPSNSPNVSRSSGAPNSSPVRATGTALVSSSRTSSAAAAAGSARSSPALTRNAAAAGSARSSPALTRNTATDNRATVLIDRDLDNRATVVLSPKTVAPVTLLSSKSPRDEPTSPKSPPSSEMGPPSVPAPAPPARASRANVSPKKELDDSLVEAYNQIETSDMLIAEDFSSMMEDELIGMLGKHNLEI